MHHATTLIDLFNQQFQALHKTCLVGGGEEPLYQPAGPNFSLHQIIFTRDYFASALHEVAHWCLAGPMRRQQVDYGYWYAPDGRTLEQQRIFERVEVKPQALEWISAMACGYVFRVSADNLTLEAKVSDEFRQNISSQAKCYCLNGLPRRAQQWVTVLARYWGQQDVLNPNLYECQNLQ